MQMLWMGNNRDKGQYVCILSRHCIVVIHLTMLILYSVRTVTEMKRMKRQHRIEDFVWKADQTAKPIHLRKITHIIIRYICTCCLHV